MKAYHTYNAVEVAFSLLQHASVQGKYFNNMQLQKLTYISHGLSLAHFQRPLIVDDVFAWQYGPVVPSVHFRFQSHGEEVITGSLDVILDPKSDSIINEVVTELGHLSGPQLVELTRRQGSPWHQIWDGMHYKIIPDDVIEKHYLKIKEAGHTNCL